MVNEGWEMGRCRSFVGAFVSSKQPGRTEPTHLCPTASSTLMDRTLYFNNICLYSPPLGSVAQQLAQYEVSHSVRLIKGGCFLKLEEVG